VESARREDAAGGGDGTDRQWTARGPGDILDRAAYTALSGMEFLEAILAGRLPGAAIAGAMDFRLAAVAPGRAAFRGQPGFLHTNPMGGVHGGWYGTLLDSALGCAIMTLVARGRWYTTLEYKVNLVRALPLGTVVECSATVSHFGRTTATAEGTIRGLEDGRLYATGSTTCLIMGA